MVSSNDSAPYKPLCITKAASTYNMLSMDNTLYATDIL